MNIGFVGTGTWAGPMSTNMLKAGTSPHGLRYQSVRDSGILVASGASRAARTSVIAKAAPVTFYEPAQ